jgi:predicted metal-dependent peptidase
MAASNTGPVENTGQNTVEEAQKYARSIIEAEESIFSGKIAKIMQNARRFLVNAAKNSGQNEYSFTLDVVSDFYLNYVPVIESRDCPTMATDYKKIMYGPKFIARLYDETICREIASMGGKDAGLYPNVKNSIEKIIAENFGVSLDNEKKKIFWENVVSSAMEVAKRESPEADLWTRRTVWARGLAGAGIIDNSAEPSVAVLQGINAVDEGFLSSEGNIKSFINNNFLATVGAILLHEVMHIIRGDVAESDRQRQEYIWKSNPNGHGRHDEAGAELLQMLNRAMDAVINDIIENELLVHEKRNSTGYRNSIKNRILPEWTITKENARQLETRAIYIEAVTQACINMREALGKKGEYKAPNGIIPLEREFRELFLECAKEQDKIRQMMQQQGQNPGSGQKQQTGENNGEQGQISGDGDGGQEQEGQERGPGEKEGNGQDSSGSKKGKGKKKSSGQGKEKDDEQSQGNSGKPDWSEWHKKNPRKHVHNAIAKVFGGQEAPDRSDPPGEQGTGSGQEEGQPGRDGGSGGRGNGTPADWNEYPGKPVDNHEMIEDEVKKSEEEGKDPHKEVEDILKPVIKRHMEKSETRQKGSGSAFADILIELAKDDELPPPTFKERVTRALHSIFSPLPKKTYERIPKEFYGIAPQFAQHGRGVILPFFKRPRNRGHICIGIDVSGSMGNEDVRAAVVETISLLNVIGMGHKVTIVQMDDGIVDWQEFLTGSPKLEEFRRDIEKNGFHRHGAGGTEYNELFEIFSGAEIRKQVEHGNKIPEKFMDRDYGVPMRVEPADVMLVFTDWGFSDTNLAELKKTALFWVGVTDRPGYAKPRQGEIIECDELAVNRMQAEPSF